MMYRFIKLEFDCKVIISQMRPFSSNKKTRYSPSNTKLKTHIKSEKSENRDKYKSTPSNMRTFDFRTFPKPKQNKQTYPQKSIYLCQSAKDIALIHAYQPRLLKKCLVSDPKSYNKFYYQNSGLCMVNNLYTVSFMAHFREWRKNIRNKIFKLISELLKLELSVQSKDITSVAQQIQKLSEQLKEEAQMVSKQKQLTLSVEASDLYQRFKSLRQYMAHLIFILKNFCESVDIISKLLSEAYEGTRNVNECKQKIKRLSQSFKLKVNQSFNYCSTHAQSQFMNKAEFRIKQRFNEMEDGALELLKKIILLVNFKEKLEKISNSRNISGQLTQQVLQEVINVIGQLQSIITKVSNLKQKETNYFARSKPEFQNILKKIQEEIIKLMSQFLARFERKIWKFLESQQNALRKKKIFDCLQQEQKSFANCKKRILLYAKVFNKTTCPSTYDLLTNHIKQTSQSYQQQNEIIQQLTQKINKRKVNLKQQEIEKQIQYITDLIQKFERNRGVITQSIRNAIKAKTGLDLDLEEGTQIQSESDHFKKILRKKSLYEVSTQSLLVVPKKEKKQKMTRSELKLVQQQEIERIRRLFQQQFPKIKQKTKQLQSLYNDELIKKFIDAPKSKKRSLDYAVEIFERMFFKLKEGEQEYLEDTLNYFHLAQFQINENLKSIGEYKNSKIAEAFIFHLFFTFVEGFVLKKTQNIEIVLNDQINTEYFSIRSNQRNILACSRYNPQTKKCISDFQQLYDIIFRSVSQKQMRYTEQNSNIQKYLKGLISKVREIQFKQSVFQLYDYSVKTNYYWPGPIILHQWCLLQFTCTLQGKVDEETLKKRNQMRKFLVQKTQCLESLFQDPQKKKVLGSRFFQQCRQKISLITTLLLPFTEISFDQNLLKRYKEICNNIQAYLRKSGIYHIGIYFQNQDPLTFFYSEKHNETERLMVGIEKIFRLPFHIDKNSGDKMLIAVEHPDKLKRGKSVKTINNQCEISIIKPHSLLQIELLYQEYFYYRLNKFHSFSQVLKSLQNASSHSQLVKKWIDYDKLGHIFEEEQPNMVLHDHLTQIEKRLQESNSFFLLNENHEPSQLQKIMKCLIQSLQIEDMSGERKRYSIFRQFLQQIGYDYKFLYGEQIEGNKLILCQYGEQGNYAYAVLRDKNPLKDVLSFKNQKAVRIQKLFLKTMFSIPYEKNKELMTIIEEIENTAYEGQFWKESILKYEQYQLKNKREIEQKVRKYIDQKQIKLEITKPQTINYESYKLFLHQYIKIRSTQRIKNNLYSIIVDMDKQLPIFCSTEYNDLKQVLETVEDQQAKSIFSIIPQKYNISYYVQRISQQVINIKLKQILEDVTGQINKKIQVVKPNKILQLFIKLSKSKSLRKKQKRENSSNSNNYSSVNQERQIKVFENTLLILGRENPIRLSLRRRKQTLNQNEEINSFIAQMSNYFLGLPEREENNKEIQKEQKFMESTQDQDDEKQFILHDSKFLTKIHQKLQSFNIGHRVIRYEGKILNILDCEIDPFNGITQTISLQDQKSIVYEINQNNIEVLTVFFYLSFSSVLKKQRDLFRYIDQYFVQIKSKKFTGTIKNLEKLIQQPLKIQCDIPQSGIELTLKKWVNEPQGVSEEKVLKKFTIRFYRYGCTYLLKCFESILIKEISEEREVRFEQEKIRQQQESQKKQNREKRKRLEIIQKLKTEQLFEPSQNDWSDEISVVLSADLDIQSENIIELKWKKEKQEQQMENYNLFQ